MTGLVWNEIEKKWEFVNLRTNKVIAYTNDTDDYPLAHRPRALQKIIIRVCQCRFKMGHLNVTRYHNLNKCYTRIWVPINEWSTNVNRYHN